MNRVAIRLIGAPLLLAALGACLWVDWKRLQRGWAPLAIPIVLCFFSVWSFRELCAMGRLKGLKPYEWIGWVLLPLPYAAVVLRLEVDLLQLLMGIGFAGFLLSLVMHFASKSPQSTLFTILWFSYMNLLSSTLFMQGSTLFLWWLLFLLATGKGSDMAAYSVGKTMGRHKMAPRISPNKTWEGAIGGLVAGTLLGWWVLESSGIGWIQVLYGIDPATGKRPPCEMVRTLQVWHFLTMATFVCIAAQVGDLVKSAVKRWAGVKDSGKLLPEFGGTLDMIDSFVLNAPVAALAYEIMRLATAPC